MIIQNTFIMSCCSSTSFQRLKMNYIMKLNSDPSKNSHEVKIKNSLVGISQATNFTTLAVHNTLYQKHM